MSISGNPGCFRRATGSSENKKLITYSVRMTRMGFRTYLVGGILSKSLDVDLYFSPGTYLRRWKKSRTSTLSQQLFSLSSLVALRRMQQGGDGRKPVMDERRLVAGNCGRHVLRVRLLKLRRRSEALASFKSISSIWQDKSLQFWFL